MQQFAIASLFLVALGYVGRLIYASFQSQGTCTSGCGKCAVVDFDKIEAQIKSRKS